MKILLFDLDGTLIDTLEDLMDASNYTIGKYGYSPATLLEYRSFIGHGIDDLLKKAMRGNTKHFDAIRKEFLEYYGKHCCNKSKIYPGIKQLIEDCYKDGYKMIVVTNKIHDLACKMIDYFFPNQFMEVYGQSTLFPKKPDPTIIHHIQDLMNQRDLILIGDSKVDIQTANNAGIESIGVTWGFGHEDDIIQQMPTYLAHTSDCLKEIIYDRSK